MITSNWTNTAISGTCSIINKQHVRNCRDKLTKVQCWQSYLQGGTKHKKWRRRSNTTQLWLQYFELKREETVNHDAIDLQMHKLDRIPTHLAGETSSFDVNQSGHCSGLLADKYGQLSFLNTRHGQGLISLLTLTNLYIVPLILASLEAVLLISTNLEIIQFLRRQ